MSTVNGGGLWQQVWGKIPEQRMMPTLAERAQLSMRSNLIKISHIWRSDKKEDTEEKKAPKGFEKFFKKKESIAEK